MTIMITNKYIAIVLLVAACRATCQSIPHEYSVSSRALPDGHSDITITNIATSPIVAFHVGTQCPPFNREMIQDYLLFNEHMWQLMTGRSYTFNFPRVPEKCPVKVDAVVFANGQSSGDAKAITDFYTHRRGVQEELAILRPIIAKAATGNLDEKSLQAYFKDREDAMTKHPTASRPEGHGQGTALSTIQSHMGFLVESGASTSNDTDVTERAKRGLEFIDSWNAKLNATGAIQ